MARPSRTGSAVRAAGFTYLVVLFAVAIVGAGLATLGSAWSSLDQQAREAELLYVGHQFRLAIGRYYQKSAGAAKRYPASLDDLLKDPRFPGHERHLRRPYLDPMTASADWGLVAAPGGGIMGVFSKSAKRPLKEANFAPPNRIFEEVSVRRGEELSYADWQFVYLPPGMAGLPAAAAPRMKP